MQQISQQSIVNYPAEDVYKLVDEIDLYSEFLPWCASSEVHERKEDQVEATIMLQKGMISQAFTTQNTLTKDPLEIEMNLVEGPFSKLHGVWKFKPLSETSCKISLDMEFAISNPLLRITLEPVFTQVLNRLVDAFKQRAKDLYG